MLLSILLLLSLHLVVCTSGVVKILEGVDRKSDKDDNSLEYVEPDPICGPTDLYFLKGSCFVGSFDRYEYTICPFHNVTQRRTTAAKPQIIGLWGHWTTTNSPIHLYKGQKGKPSPATIASETNTAAGTVSIPEGQSLAYYNVMEYTHGRNCGQGSGSTTIYLECARSKFEVVSIDSELNCEYALTLGLPIACHLLLGS